MEQAGSEAQASAAVREPEESRVDLRDQFVSLVVRPGTPVVAAHLRDSRHVMSHMADLLEEYAKLEQEHARKLTALANSAHAKFEKASVTQRATSWLGLKSSGNATETIAEYGTTNAAWQSVREGITAAANSHLQMSALVQAQVVDSMKDYLNDTQAQATKVEGWGLKLSDAMDNYVRRAEEAKQTYFSRAKACRTNYKFLEEAQKQAQIGGITRGVILTSSRLAKLKETAEQSRADELASAQEYQAAVDLVAKKRNELYTMRLPRVFQEIQRLTEDRTERIKVELAKFVQIGQDTTPGICTAFASMEQPVQGINSSIDSRVFVAANVSDDTIPPIMEFEAYDQQSMTLISSSSPQSGQAGLIVESDLANLLAEQENRDSLIASLIDKDPVSASAVSFHHDCESFRRQVGDTSAIAVSIHHKYLADDATELVPISAEQKAQLAARIMQNDTSDKSMFSSVATEVLRHLESSEHVKAWLEKYVASHSKPVEAPLQSSPATEKPSSPSSSSPKTSKASDGLKIVEDVLGIPRSSSASERSNERPAPPTSSETTPSNKAATENSESPHLVLLGRQSATALAQEDALLAEDDLLNDDDDLLNNDVDRIDDVLLGEDSFIDDDEDVKFEGE